MKTNIMVEDGKEDARVEGMTKYAFYGRGEGIESGGCSKVCFL